MSKLICRNCRAVFDKPDHGRCPRCNIADPHVYHFENSDVYLEEQIPRVLEERKRLGMEGLVGGLACVIINTEADRQKTVVDELLRYTGLIFDDAFEDSECRTVVLQTGGSADFLIRSRIRGNNPFLSYNDFPKSKHLPGTRLETFIFRVDDIEKYIGIQKSRGVRFMKDHAVPSDHSAFIQTRPLKATGTSIGVIEWKGDKGQYRSSDSRPLKWEFNKPDTKYLRDIKELDHTALRIRAEDRDAAIIEFMELTNYTFDFAIYVKLFNSITNVARLSGENFAMVFTSGISSYIDEKTSGPTEKFIHNYGTRVHHMAFRTENIEDTVDNLKQDGMDFLIDLVGSPEEGLRQTFTAASKHTLLVNEYIHRYDDFDGFFTRSNVTLLTGATDKQ